MNPFVRPSALGVAEFCPTSTVLSEQSGIGRSAILSTAWHAKEAGNDTLIGELHPSERKEVQSYGSPTDPTVNGITLRYAYAIHETHVQVWEGDTLITEGTPDFYWIEEVEGRRWLFVADLKRNAWGVPDGADCLQLAAYGHGLATKHSCEGYTPGLWSGTDSEWFWGTPVDLTSPDALDLWLRIKRAANNDARKLSGDKARPVTGEHCKHCWGRMRCPEWSALSLHALNTGHEEVTDETAGYILLAAQAAEEHAGQLKETIKAHAQRGGIVRDPASGKVYLPTVTRGREALDKESLLKEYPDASRFWKKGKPGLQFGWRKP
jgi:hypothetical protein